MDSFCKGAYYEYTKKDIKFIPATCPRCSGNLEIDSNFEIVYCLQCGLKCVIDDKVSRKRKQKITTFDKVIGFVERQQTIKRKEKQVKLQKQGEEEQRNREWWKKYWWVLPTIFVVLYAVIIVMSIIGG